MPDAPETPELKPGTITRLGAQKRDAQRVSVFLDGTFAFGIHQDMLVQFGLRKGDRLTVEQQRKIIAAEQALGANVAALNYLGYKPRTEHEVRQKLLRSGYPEAIAEQTVDRLRDLGYLDDAAYAHTFAQQRFQGKGYGPRRIQNDLRKRGVAAATIDAVLAALETEEDLLSGAREQAEKRWARLVRTETDDRKRRKKLGDFLMRRGYGYDVVRQVTDELEA